MPTPTYFNNNPHQPVYLHSTYRNAQYSCYFQPLFQAHLLLLAIPTDVSTYLFSTSFHMDHTFYQIRSFFNES